MKSLEKSRNYMHDMTEREIEIAKLMEKNTALSMEIDRLKSKKNITVAEKGKLVKLKSDKKKIETEIAVLQVKR